MRLWRSRDLISWEELGEPFSLLDGYWAKQESEAFTGDRSGWHLWAPEVHYLNGKWHILHTTGGPIRHGSNLAVTQGDQIAGPWKHIGPPLFEQDGGHGMLFKNFEGELLLSIHQPNRGSLERLHLFHVEDAGDRLILGDEVKLP